MQDIELKCRDCGETFTFTAGEQGVLSAERLYKSTHKMSEPQSQKAQRNNFNSDSH